MPYSVILTEIWHPFSQSCSNRCSFRNFGLNLFYEHLSKAGAFRLPRKPCIAWLPFCSQNETTSCAGLAQVVILSTYSTGPSP